jgi:hypothetical protein
VTVRHLLFDVDDVISRRQSPGSVPWLAVTSGMNRSDFATIYSRHRSGDELATSRAGCWPKAVGRDMGRDDELLDDLDSQDILSLTRPRVDVLPMLYEARANGGGLNLIANVPKPLESAYDQSKSRGSSSAALFSADSGHAAPEVQAFDGALAFVGASTKMSSTSGATREPWAAEEVGRKRISSSLSAVFARISLILRAGDHGKGKPPGARRRLTPLRSSPGNPQRLSSIPGPRGTHL